MHLSLRSFCNGTLFGHTAAGFSPTSLGVGKEEQISPVISNLPESVCVCVCVCVCLFGFEASALPVLVKHKLHISHPVKGGH